MSAEVNVTISGDASGLFDTLGDVKQATKEWERAFAPIDRAFSQSVTGIITGTQTARQAIAKMETSLIASFIDSAEKGVTAWLAAELAKTTATEAGAAARTAANTSADSNALVLIAEQALKAIAAYAAQAFAAVYALFAPGMGPAAAGPAAASQATVIAVAADVPGMAVGAWDVPGNMLAMIHQGETVLPRDFASGFRAAAGGGGSSGASAPTPGGGAPNAHISIQAMDGASVQRVLGANHGAVASALRKAWRNGSRSLG